MKKITAVILSAALLAGCSTSTAAVSPSAAATAAATAAAETASAVKTDGTAAAGGVTLNTSTADMSGYTWLQDSDPAYAEITLKESIRMFTEKGTGVLYYGKVGCPWCQRAVPIMDEAAKEAGLTIYYVDVAQPVEKADYESLVTYISSIFEKDSEGNPMFQVPEVIAVKDGQIVGHHLSLVESFTLANENDQMNDDQKQELLNTYLDMFKALK
jgi:predicted bacteriocin transport accessory protein